MQIRMTLLGPIPAEYGSGIHLHPVLRTPAHDTSGCLILESTVIIIWKTLDAVCHIARARQYLAMGERR